MSPLHDDFDAQLRLPLKQMESRLREQNFRISSMMEGSSLVSKGAEISEDHKRMNSAFMKLPQLKVSGDYFRMSNHGEQELRTPTSLIDGALEIIGTDLLEDDCINDDEVVVVPVQFENYRSKRSSRLNRKGDKRRSELLLDNAFAIEKALKVLQNNRDEYLSSGDEESHSDSDYESDL